MSWININVNNVIVILNLIYFDGIKNDYRLILKFIDINSF